MGTASTIKETPEIIGVFNPHRLFSFGGGVQSMAVLVLQAQGQLKNPFHGFIFANVGDDSENPATLQYIQTIVRPYAEQHRIPLIEVQKTTYGKPETLVEYLCRTKRSVPIPARRSNGAPGNRSCTNDFKIRVVDKWVREQGYEWCEIGLGSSIDEFTRMRDEQWHDSYGKRTIGYNKRRDHPLIHLGLTRFDCVAIIKAAGLPIPPKSSCFFCPFMRTNEWIRMRIEDLDLFQCAVLVEKVINRKRRAIGRDYVYLHPACVPLLHAVPLQPMLPGFNPVEQPLEICGGYCRV